MTTLVMKFGGNVLGSPTGVVDTLQIIAAQRQIWERLVVVTSAFSGVTDTLYSIVQTAQRGDRSAYRRDIARLREIHQQAAMTALSDSYRLESLLQELDVLFFNLMDDCDIIREQHQAEPAIADRVVAMGEMWVTRIVAAAGRAQGLSCAALDASRLIVTDDRHANARPITSLSQKFLEQNLLPLLERKVIPIITGFIGANERGDVTTLGRGGSDYSTTYLAALLNADEVWFYTNVDGLMTADPAVVSSARMLPTSSYKEVAEMARFGARVVHPRAMEPMIQANIPLRIRSVTHPDNTGTYICDYINPDQQRIHAITQGLGVRVRGSSQSNMTDVCNRLLSQYLNDDIQPTLQVDVHGGSQVVYVAPTSANQEAFHESIKHLKNYSEEWQVDIVAVIAIIGSLNTKDHIDVLQKLSAAHISPEVFGHGAPGNVFVLAVNPDDAHMAITQIHKLIKQ